ncbi:MAG: hypothetical protein LC737_03635, partial [Chloroflexi bacterium]|nr:hypothetical protein [Chloroflexota bacterium]
ELGLLSVDVPPVSNGVLGVERTLSKLEQVAVLISALSAAFFVWLIRRRWLLGAAGVFFIITALVLLNQTHERVPQSINAQIADVADLVSVRYNSASAHAGAELRVTLTWLARRAVSENVKVFVHLTDASGARVLAQSDGEPVGGFTPTTRWHAGELVEDTRVLRVPDDAQGDLNLFVGMYRFPSLERLPALHDGLPYPNERIPLGELHVEH